MAIIIEPAAPLAYSVISTARDNRPGCLSVIGSPDTDVLVQIPAVKDPLPATDAHWQNLYINDEQVKLTATHMAAAIPVGLKIRVVKQATSSAVGVEWS